MIQWIILFSAFLPYCSILLRLPTDVQPWAALWAWIYFAALCYRSGGLSRVTKTEVLLFIICVTFLIRIDYDSTGDLFLYLRKTVVFILTISLLYVARYFTLRRMRLALLGSTVIYLSFAVLQYISTSAYVAIAGQLTRLKDVNIGARGAASLAPEATDFGLTMVYVIVIALVLRARDPEHATVLGFNVYTLTIALAGICIVLSKSGTGFIGAAVLGTIAFASLTHYRRYAVAAIAVTAVVVFTMIMLPDSVIQRFRGLQLLFAVFSGAEFLFQTSFAHRSIHNIVGVIAFFESYGLGNGAGSFVSVGPEIYDRYGLATQFGMSSWHQAAVRDTLASNALGVIPLLLTEYGAVGLLFICLVFSIVWKSSLPYRYAILALMGMTWIQSFPAAYPMFWILVGLAYHPQFVSSRRRFQFRSMRKSVGQFRRG